MVLIASPRPARARRIQAARFGCANSVAEAPSPSEANDDRLRCSVERRRRAGGRGQGDPRGRRPAAVEDRSVGSERGKTPWPVT
jgi:hypothetical protein